MNEPGIILHQYELSPISGKVRATLSIKLPRWSAYNPPSPE